MGYNGSPMRVHWKDDLLICKKCFIPKNEKDFSDDKREKYRNFKCVYCRDCARKLSKKYFLERKTDLKFYLQRLIYGITHKLKNTKSNYKKYKDLEMLITPEDLYDLYIKQNGKCAISGMEMTHFIGQGRVIKNISIDRIDSFKGYIKDNIQLTCLIVNTMKSDLDKDSFLDICKIIIENNK